MAYLKESKKHYSSLTIQDFNLTEADFFDPTDDIKASTYMKLILNTPSCQSNLKTEVNKRFKIHIDEYVDYIKGEMDIKHIYFFDTFITKDTLKVDISKKVKDGSGSFLYLYCNNSFGEAFFSGIRNALAHGNVMKKGNYYYLYSLSSKGEEKDDFRKNIKFMLKVKDIKRLDAIIFGFEKYNK